MATCTSERPASEASLGLIETLISRLSIHVSGACGPNHTEPLELFYSSCRAYNAFQSNDHGDRSSLRLIPSSRAKDDVAVVQDQDVMTTWRIPDTATSYEEKAFETVLARETIIVAAEAYLDSQTDLRTVTADSALLGNFHQYLSEIGAQPVTVSIQSIVDGMIDAFMGCRGSLQGFEVFAWPKSPTFRTELEDFIFTRECWFYNPEWLPAVKATFQTSRFYGPQQEIPVTVHYAWNPPTINFVDLQNVFQEHRPVVLAPTLGHMVGHPRSGRDTTEIEYETDLPSNIGWNMMTRRLEGKWPSSLAGFAGAERLESFTLPLGVAATLTTTFPGNVKLERILRVAVPVSIKRKADDCSSLPTTEPSPAASKKIGSWRPCRTPTAQLNRKLARLSRCDSGVSLPAPQSTLPVNTMLHYTPPDRSAAGRATPSTTTPTISPRAQKQPSPISYKELTELLARKAKEGHTTSPIELNPLSMARIWEATMLSPEVKDIQCWAVSVEDKSSDDKGRASLRAIASLCTQKAVSGALPLNEPEDVFGGESEYRLSPNTSASKPRRDTGFSVWTDAAGGVSPENAGGADISSQVPRRLPFRCISGNEQAATSESLKHVHSALTPMEKCTACQTMLKHSSALEPCNPSGPSINPSKRRDSTSSLVPDSKPQPKPENDRTGFRIPSDIPVELLESIWAEDSDWETCPLEPCNFEDVETAYEPVRMRRLENWRKEPEKLNEAEVDELQWAIQASYRESEGRLGGMREEVGDESPIDGYESGEEGEFGEDL